MDVWAADYSSWDEDMTFMSGSDDGLYEYERGWSYGYLACLVDMAGESHELKLLNLCLFNIDF